MLHSWAVLCLAVSSFAVPATISAEPQATPARITSHILRQRVESTAIAAIGYSKRRHILEIEFVNGAIYRYLDVPPTVHRELVSAESKARFYDSNIRRHYRSILIRARQKQSNHQSASAAATARQVNTNAHERTRIKKRAAQRTMRINANDLL